MNTVLSTFLESPQRPDGTLSFHELEGLLFAITCSPEAILPSEWISLIFDDQDANYASMEEAQSVLEALMGLYNDINGQVFEGEVTFPGDIQFRPPPLDNFDEAAPLGQWARGFTIGHNWLFELWDEYTPEALDSELGSCLMALSFYSSRELAEAYYGDIEEPSFTFEEFAETVFGLLDDALDNYAQLSCSIRLALEEQDETEQPFVREERVGRNDPCPCGSGKKYKKCCLQ